jgi:hypothetical protein
MNEWEITEDLLEETVRKELKEIEISEGENNESILSESFVE